MLDPNTLSKYNKLGSIEEILQQEKNKAKSEKVAADMKLKLINKLENNKGLGVFNGATDVINTPKVYFGSLDYDLIMIPAAVIVSDWLKEKGYETEIKWVGLDEGTNDNPRYSYAEVIFGVHIKEDSGEKM